MAGEIFIAPEAQEALRKELGPDLLLGKAPQVTELKVWREVAIRKAENGFIVAVGCKTFVFEEWADCVDAMTAYWKDPVAAQKEYCKN